MVKKSMRVTSKFPPKTQRGDGWKGVVVLAILCIQLALSYGHRALFLMTALGGRWLAHIAMIPLIMCLSQLCLSTNTPAGHCPPPPCPQNTLSFFFWGGGRTTHPPPQAATVSLPQTHGRSGPYWKPKAQGCESPPSHVNNNNDNTTHCFPSGGLECTLLILLQHAHKSVQF